MQELINKMLSVKVSKIQQIKRSELYRYTELADLPSYAINMPILVDADSRVWRASYVEYGMRTKEQALDSFNRSLWYIKQYVVRAHVGGADAMNALSTEEFNDLMGKVNLVLFMGSDRSFRHKHYKRYKLNRALNTTDSAAAATTKLAEDYMDYISKNCGEQVIRVSGLEADDAIGIMSDLHDNKVIIWSPDKDLSTIPGIRAHDEQGVLTVRKVTPMQAQLNKFLQYLIGDQSDGYTGIPGLFSKEAFAYMNVLEQSGKILSDEEMTALVIGLYKRIMGESIEEYAKRTISMASILRQSNVTDTHIKTVSGEVIALD